jgi:hypothetical protein
MRTSKFSYGDKKLHELDKDSLLDCVEAMWNNKNAEIEGLQAQVKAYQSMISSPHNIWRGFADNASLLIWASFVMYLLAQATFK